MPSAVLNGNEIYYEDSGESGLEPVLCMHSLIFDRRMFDALRELMRGEFRFVCYDHRGQGRSAVPQGREPIDMQTCAEDARALIHYLNIDSVHVIAQSMGGDVALRLALDHPECVRTLSLLGASACAEDPRNLPRFRMLTWILRLVGPRPVLGPTMNIMFGKSFLRDSSRRDTLRLWRRRIAGVRRDCYRAVQGVIERSSVEDALHRLRPPVLIVSGSEDLARPPEWSRAMHARIPDSIRKVLPAVGHSPVIEAPQAVARILRPFLKSNRGAPS